MSTNDRAAVKQWMEREAAEPDGGFKYCCEVAEENGLTYAALRALLAENERLRAALERIAEFEGGINRDLSYKEIAHEALRAVRG